MTAPFGSPPDFILPTSRTTVTINFTNNTVTLGNSTRVWALTNYTKIIGSNNSVRVKSTPDMKVEVISGPAGFAIPHPDIDPGKRYVYLEGVKNKWKNIKETLTQP